MLKQILHGDMGYDDPVEVTTYDPATPTPTVTKLYPIYDEAAAGALQVVVNKDGVVVARSVNNDSFGGAEFDLAGAGIDNATVSAKKDNSGNLSTVTVTMRATEPLAPASVATGARLAAVDASGALIRPFSPAPALDPDGFTLRWTMTGSEWTSLTTPTGAPRPPASLSIAATSTLRAAVWSLDTPILPAPDWVTSSKPVFTSAALPVEIRESLSNLNAMIGSLGPNESKTTTSYDIPNLGLLGTSEGGSAEVEGLLAATFQAQPFAEPFTRKFYVRERWYDPMTATWLRPDPMGYKDSSNLYGFAAGDPVNGRDSTGLAVATTSDGSFYVTNSKNGKRHLLPNRWVRENQLAAQDIVQYEGGLSAMTPRNGCMTTA